MSSKAELIWKPRPDGLVVSCERAGQALPVREWASTPAAGRISKAPVDPGTLLGVLETLQELGRIEEYLDSTEVLVPSAVIASLSDSDLRGAGLYPPVPFVLWLDIKGSVSSENFELITSWRTTKARPVMGVSRHGCVLQVGEDRYILTEPFFSLMEARDEFEQHAAGGSIAGTMEALAKVQEYLPEDIHLSQGLRRMRVVRAGSFSVLPVQRDNGAPDFRVRLLVDADETRALSDGDGVVPVLPEEAETQFQRRFREFREERRVYPVDGGWYVVASPDLAKALSATRKATELSGAGMVDFLRNPAAFVREQLGDLMSEERLSEVLREMEDYSDRVRDVGIWEPKVLPWLRTTGQEWLPPELIRPDDVESIGVRVGDDIVPIPKDELPGLLEQVRGARKRGESTVRFGPHEIPATEEMEKSLGELSDAIDPDRKVRPGAADESPSRIAVLIQDNLNELHYRRNPREAAVAIGGMRDGLITDPLPHQEAALGWLEQHWVAGSPGALLADDMGLGKTLVGLAFMAWVRKQRTGPCLVVAPTGLLQNWMEEHDKHLVPPGLGKIVVAQGRELRDLKLPEAAKGQELTRGAGLPTLDIDRIRSHGLVLASYETVRDYQHSFARVPWGAVLMDEAQRIKNPSALMTDAAKALQSEFTLIMTGTPVENRIADLWSLLDTSYPGRFGSLRDFVAQYDVDLTEDRTVLERLQAELTTASELGPPVMLRRLKRNHLTALPSQEVTAIREQMPSPQAKVYSDTLEQGRTSLGDRGAMLKILQQMKKVSLHPFASDGQADEDYVSASARMLVTFRILDEVFSRSEKALLFVESRTVQCHLVALIQRRYGLARPPMVINGAVSGPVRQARVREFQSSPDSDVMILSPRAGGVGLTLTAANNVIHLSRWWNPAVEDQCTDRVYRIGQNRDVRVYLPIAVHPEFGDRSFDVQLDALLGSKRALSAAALAPVTQSQADIENLIARVLPGEEVLEGQSVPDADLPQGL